MAYEPLPSAPHFKIKELAGEWHGPEGARLTLSETGALAAVKLRGQETDFDDHWSLSGKGSWQVLDSYKGGHAVAEGQMVQLTVKGGESRTAAVGQAELDGSHSASQGRKSSPTAYTWAMSVKKVGSALRLYYVVGDPDARWLCEFTRT
ncbi:hypothetical protein AB0C11_17580 [Streptomyces sp. NPDC039016]|uniref:hypothetical protein n=1 Tax=Streptomyces sp. NPDC039016 TaxID=3154330 RepID=UPI0033DFCE7B